MLICFDKLLVDMLDDYMAPPQQLSDYHFYHVLGL